MTWILHPHSPARRANSYTEGSVCARQEAGHLLTALGTYLSAGALRKENTRQRSARCAPRQPNSIRPPNSHSPSGFSDTTQG